jgi:hypothetical protein
MKKTGLLLMSIMGLGILVQAQDAENLVENPSFEQMEGKIKKSGGNCSCCGLDVTDIAAADLFSAKVKEGFGTPSNALGSGSCYGW